MFRHYLRQTKSLLLQMFYSGKQFKLLLRITLEHLDIRLQALASLTDFFSAVVTPIPITAPFGKSMLVVAPHQDDEVIGCGGTLALQVLNGNAASAVILQDGADEHDSVSMTREALVELRNQESRDAARMVGIDSPIFLGLRDLSLNADATALALRQIIEERHVDAIFTPFVLDGHPDHRTCNFILARALSKSNRTIRILQYEVWSLCIPNVVVVIDSVADKKWEMLACFRFANKAFDYAHATKGLNMFHSRLLPAGQANYVECFFELPRKEFVELVEKLERAESGDSRRSGPIYHAPMTNASSHRRVIPQAMPLTIS
jgi:LmbE family N-acetylglucosaminyl deacetylase